jgi:hypothetical protein
MEHNLQRGVTWSFFFSSLDKSTLNLQLLSWCYFTNILALNQIISH